MMATKTLKRFFSRSMSDPHRDMIVHSPPPPPPPPSCHELSYGRTIECIPERPIVPWASRVESSFTGPCGGITRLDPYSNELPRDPEEVAGSKDWNVPTEFAYGMSLSLYEEDRAKQSMKMINGVPQMTSALLGEPVADVFGVIVRENSAIVAVADGVSWGIKPRLAARCAVRAVMDHFANNIRKLQTRSASSRLVSTMLLESIKAAQKCILEHGATLTTLSVAVLCQLTKAGDWGMFTVSVGDSPIFVYCPRAQKVIEATVGCHSKTGERDMRMAGGTLGPSIGTKPDLANLSLAYMPICKHDIVIIASDGISDNFSSQVNHEFSNEFSDSDSDSVDGSIEVIYNPNLKSCDKNVHLSPVIVQNNQISTHQRVLDCCDSSLHLSSILRKHHVDLGHQMSAQTVCACLMNYTVTVTDEKRRFMSDCRVKGIEVRRKCKDEPEFAEKVKKLSGKLDHATIVAYQVGHK